MLSLSIKQIITETADTKTFIFETGNNSKLSYKAGQFITITLNRNGKELRRSYSLSTAPAFDDFTAFTLKQVANGEVSRYLFRTITPGSVLHALEPGGRFTFENDIKEPRDIFLIAAGSGVTPVYSLLKQILRTTTGHSIKLIMQNRNEKAVIFHDSLNHLAQEYSGNFKLISYLSRPIDRHKKWRRLNNEILEGIILDQMNFARNNARFYICGPLSFMRMAEFTIRQMGFLPGQVKKEIFDVPRLPPPPFLIDPAPRVIRLSKQSTLAPGEHLPTIIPVSFPQSILEAVLLHQIKIPYSCKAGICGSCVVQCSSGEVKMKHNDVLTDEEVASGLVLSCVGYAVTDITLNL
ncbi:MAG: iron-sulfur cluster-binding domain-containing protein [Chitinophagaceae bacterium]|nr:MAG: iron-sulfur cluster-binding domain-containing protein [Chitinophagaceae bacterium]